MNPATTAKLPKKTSGEVNDCDDPAWAGDMLDAPVLRRGRGRGRGRGPQAAPTKVMTFVRLDAEILAFFNATGAGYQPRINVALRTEVERHLTSRPRATTRRRVAA